MTSDPPQLILSTTTYVAAVGAIVVCSVENSVLCVDTVGEIDGAIVGDILVDCVNVFTVESSVAVCTDGSDVGLIVGDATGATVLETIFSGVVDAVVGESVRISA